jgi:putative tryptophan/tyrosine transport system substrate-binding protein
MRDPEFGEDTVRRRDFIKAIVGSTAAWPLAARAQQRGRVYRLGFLTTRSGPASEHHALEAALANLGYREAQNLVIERRYAGGNLERLPALAAELRDARVDVIVTETSPAALAAKQATTTIPIVMATGADAVRSGLVASLARPGGNVTGLTFIGTETITKTLEFLREFNPRIRRVGYLGTRAIVPERITFDQLQATATVLGIEATFVDVPALGGFEPAFASMVEGKLDAMISANSAPFAERREQIVGLAARHKLLAGYGRRAFVEAGGLLSYGTSFPDMFRRSATFVDKILKGAKPADLPVEQPTHFELVINLKTAKALGLDLPPTLRVFATEVIE